MSKHCAFALVKAVSLGVVLSTAVVAGAAGESSVFTGAAAWWRFDQGGADGVLATQSEIHDVRDPSLNQPSALYGSQGGPLWSVMDVRLPYQRRTVRSTALHFPCDTRVSTTSQYWFASLAFSGLHTHGSELSLVARVRFEGLGVNAADTMLWNNAFSWGANAGSVLGFIKCSAGQRGAIATYVPYVFVAQNMFGNNPSSDKVLAMKVGEWYDVAFLLSEETDGGDRYDVVTFVVADRSGLRTQTLRKKSKRNASATTSGTKMAAMSNNSGWAAYDASKIANNAGDGLKNFDGWVHQLAVWHRKLTLDEVKEAFGRPAEPHEQNVFSDASNWIRFDRDLNGDGKLQDDEVRDLRNWNRPQDGKPVIVSQHGPLGGPAWTNVTVDLPGRGASISSPCLYFPMPTNVTVNGSGQTICSAWPSGVRLANMSRAGSYTVMARIYPYRFIGAVANVNGYFYNNGLDWGSWSGSEFGVGATDSTGTSLFPRLLLAHATYEARELSMTTNAWYDIAFSITDNGFDAAGKARTDTAIVALQDIQHGFRYSVLDISTNAYTTFATWTPNAILGGENTYDKMTDFYNLDTKSQISNANSGKCFHGMIHEVAVWNRALTTNEIAAAFAQANNMVMNVGSTDGAATEFAGTEGSYDCNVDATGTAWRDIAGTLDAGHPTLTLRFTPESNNVLLPHFLHVKAAGVGIADGEKARLTLRVNGREVAPVQDVGAYDELWCVLPRRTLKSGENVLQIAYAGGTAASFALDSAEIVGSWQLGKKDNQDGEFTQEGAERAAPDFTIGNRRLMHMVRAVTSSWRNNYIHFYLPSELAAKHSFAFEMPVVNQGSTTNNRIALYLNGTEKFASPTDRKMAKGDLVTFKVEPGELKAGWNTLDIRFTDTSGWITFDYFKFFLTDCNPGMAILFR